MTMRQDDASDIVPHLLALLLEELDSIGKATPETAIAVLATALDYALESYLGLAPEAGARIHAHVLRGLANPGPEKTVVQ